MRIIDKNGDKVVIKTSTGLFFTGDKPEVLNLDTLVKMQRKSTLIEARAAIGKDRVGKVLAA
jgi:hypothetical protein